MTCVTELVAASTEPLLALTLGSTRIIVLNRPAARNALTREMRRQFPSFIEAADQDAGIAVSILTGMDPAFSAGVDLKDRAPGRQAPITPNPGEVLRAARKPIIAAVNGACVTGALEMALSCSFIVASSQARFADTHAKLGMFPRWGQTALLPNAIGARRARQLMLTGEFIDAKTALRWGLVNEITSPAELLNRCLLLAARISGANANSVAAQHQTQKKILAASLAEGLESERRALQNWDEFR
jgi:enoyl-CoA hydratase